MEGDGKVGAEGGTPKWFEGSGDGCGDALLAEPALDDAAVEGSAEGGESRPDPFLLQLEQDEEEEEVAEGDGADAPKDHFLKLPPARTDRRAPEWAKVPPGMRFPRGIEVYFIKIRAHLTHARQNGDRVLIVWGLTDADERLALGRAMGDGNRAGIELAKQMVRAIDGLEVDWSGKPGAASIDSLWREIGGKGRGQIMRLYTQLHVYDRKEQEDFFESCVVPVATG